MPQRTVGHLFRRPMFDQLDIAHARGRSQVIHDRVSLIEPLRGDNVLVSDALVLVSRRGAVAMKPNVMLPRDLSEFLILRHRSYLPLTNCLVGPVPSRVPRR